MSRFWFLSRFCLNAQGRKEGRKILVLRSARGKLIALKKQWIGQKISDINWREKIITFFN